MTPPHRATWVLYASVGLPLVAFGPSYVNFALSARWHFAGIPSLSPLAGVARAEHLVFNSMFAHAFLTAVWMLCSFFQLRTRGKPRQQHARVGWVAVMAGMLMLLFIPHSPQMSSCWPLPPLLPRLLRSYDAVVVLGTVAQLVLSLGMGVWAARSGKMSEHSTWMEQAVLSSHSPAMMRIIMLPMLAACMLWNRSTAMRELDWARGDLDSARGLDGPRGGLDSGRGLLLVGQWLLIKEITYATLATLDHTLPLVFALIARTGNTPSPAAHSAVSTAVMTLTTRGKHAVQALICLRCVCYVVVVGVSGGELCAIYFP